MGGGGGYSGSSGGGGGSSGKVEYPAYLQSFHQQLLDDAGADTLESSLVDAINAALGASPFAGASAYNPATRLSSMSSTLTSFQVAINALSHNTDSSDAITAANTTYNTVLGTSRTATLAAAKASYSSLAADIVAKAQTTLADFESELYTSVKGRIDALMTAGESAVASDYASMMSALSTAVNSAFDTSIENASDEIKAHLADTSVAIAKNSAFETAVYTLAKSRIDALMTAGKTTVNTDYASSITAMTSAIASAYDTAIENAQAEVDAHVATSDYVSGKSSAFGVILTNEIAARSTPAIEAGYRNINAVQSSAFVIAKALVEEGRVNEVSKFTADLYFQVDRERSELIGRGTSDMLDKTAGSASSAYGAVLDYVKSTNQQMLGELGMVYNMDVSKDQIIASVTNAIMDKITSSTAQGRENVMIYVKEALNMLATELAALINVYKEDAGQTWGTFRAETAMALQGTDSGSKTALGMLMGKKELNRAYSAMAIEKDRLGIIAEDEQSKENLRIDQENAKWDLDVWQHGSNAIASIGGGTATPGTGNYGRTGTVNALGGALSGAATGAMIGSFGGGMGAAIGAGIGALVGLAGSML